MSKRKSTENRAFNKEWEIKYFFIQNSDEKPQCVLCENCLSNNKSSNLARHFSSLHEKTYGNYSDDKRRAVVDKFKKEMQVSVPASLNKKSLTASYAVCLKLAKAQKCFSDDTLVKECAIEMAKAFDHNNAAEDFATVALSKQTVKSRITDMGDSIKEKIKNLVVHCRYYSLCMDESTDRTDISQLLIFIRIIMDDFSEYEELLAVIPLHGTTTGQDIFKAVKKCIDEIDGFKKCSAIATDGAPAMIGSENGFVGHLRKNGINCLTFHCVIHQEALCEKSVRMLSAMKIVTKITNLIRGGNRSLSHRKWKTFLEEVDAEYGDLLLHSEIRWLSAGKCLVRFFALRKELAEFLSKEIKSDTTKFVKNYRIHLFYQNWHF
nr:PREDICTED: general transcription factor II-I repeat domain-containing protein 2A-like [Linepithema humile]